MRLLRASLIASLSFLAMGFNTAVLTAQSQENEVVEPSTLASVNELLDSASGMMDARRWEEAIQLLNLALEIEPNNGLVHANRAIAYGWTNRLDKASSDLAAAEKSIPGRAIIHRIRAIIAERRSDEDTELYELSKSLELEPENPMALRFRAWIFQRKGEEAKALGDADAYIRARPTDPDAYSFKAKLLQAQRKRDLAAREAKRLATLFPGDAYALSTAAGIHKVLGDRTQALQEITRAIEIDPETALYYELRAKFRNWNDIKGRRKDLETALSLEPSDLGVVTETALLDFEDGRWSKAIVEFSLILTLEPKDYGVLAYRAMAREKAGDKSNAERDYAAAMTAASGAGDFSIICETLAYEGIALDKAMAACNRAIELDSSEGDYRNSRGLVQLRLGRTDSALADFEFAIAADERLPHPFYGRALARWRKGNRVGALEDLHRARSIKPDIDEKYRQHGLVDLPSS